MSESTTEASEHQDTVFCVAFNKRSARIAIATIDPRLTLHGAARIVAPMSDKPSDKPKEQPHRSEAGNHAAEEREARLAAALRANLRRRKAQSREVQARERDAEPATNRPKS